MDALKKCRLRRIVICLCVSRSLSAADMHKDPDLIAKATDSVLLNYSIEALLNVETKTNTVFSLFVQDEITISPDKLSINFGTKLERDDLSSDPLDWMRSIRSLCQINSTNFVWSGVIRARRTPSVAELDGRINTSLTNSLGDAGLPSAPYPPTQSLLLPAHFANQIDGKANGVEIAIDWLVLDDWRIRGT